MRLRRWVSLIAVLGVLLHAGALVRHNGVMLAAAGVHAALTSDLLAICHGGVDAASNTLADLPSIPKPTNATSGCPLCSGPASAFALAAPASHEFRVATAPLVYGRPLQPSLSPRGHAVCPPARAPPALI